MHFQKETHRIYLDRISNDCLLSDYKFIKIYNFLQLNGFTLVNTPKDADVCILDLCWVVNDFLLETEDKIQEYLSSGKKIILFGCVSDTFKEKYSENLLFVDSKNYEEIEAYFDFHLSLLQIEWIQQHKKAGVFDTNTKLKDYENTLWNIGSTWFISISDGCAMNCSYCNIKKIKGNTKSSPIEKILGEVKNEIEAGKKHLYLLSDDCGSYGIDIGTNFADLLDAIFALDAEIKLYITNIYPLLFLKYYERIRKYIVQGNICSIVLPVQHTSKRILSLMNRNYNIEKIIEVLEDIKQIAPKMQMMNHIIFDYHEETLEEFKDTFRLLKYYDRNFYFRYSDVNKILREKRNTQNMKEKIILLKKLQNRFTIDITL